MELDCKKEKKITSTEDELLTETDYTYKLEAKDGTKVTIKSPVKISFLKKGSKVELRSVNRQTEIFEGDVNEKS